MSCQPEGAGAPVPALPGSELTADSSEPRPPGGSTLTKSGALPAGEWPPAPAGVLRAKSPKEVAEALGLGRRVIEVACQEAAESRGARGCPHTRLDRRKRAILLDVEEVRAWRAASGLQPDRSALFVPPSPSPTPAAGAEEAGGEPEYWTSTYKPKLTQREFVENLRQQLVEAVDQLGKMMKPERPELAPTPLLLQQITGSIKNLDHALRQQEAQLHEMEVRDGMYAERSRLADVHSELWGLVVSVLRQVAAAMAAPLRVRMVAERITPAEAEAFDRLVGLVVRELVDGQLASLARQFDQAADELGLAQGRDHAALPMHAGTPATEAA